MPNKRYIFDKEDCDKWNKAPHINPVTNFPINIESKYGVYAQLKKQCNPNKKTKTKPIPKVKAKAKAKTTPKVKATKVKTPKVNERRKLISILSNELFKFYNSVHDDQLDIRILVQVDVSTLNKSLFLNLIDKRKNQEIIPFFVELNFQFLVVSVSITKSICKISLKNDKFKIQSDLFVCSYSESGIYDCLSTLFYIVSYSKATSKLKTRTNIDSTIPQFEKLTEKFIKPIWNTFGPSI